MQEIENHFSGKSKLPRTLKRKVSIIDDPFPVRFDVNQWDSNEKFEKSLQKHNISLSAVNGNAKIHQVAAVIGTERKNVANGKIQQNNLKSVVNDDDYDTPL